MSGWAGTPWLRSPFAALSTALRLGGQSLALGKRSVRQCHNPQGSCSNSRQWGRWETRANVKACRPAGGWGWRVTKTLNYATASLSEWMYHRVYSGSSANGRATLTRSQVIWAKIVPRGSWGPGANTIEKSHCGDGDTGSGSRALPASHLDWAETRVSKSCWKQRWTEVGEPGCEGEGRGAFFWSLLVH